LVSYQLGEVMVYVGRTVRESERLVIIWNSFFESVKDEDEHGVIKKKDEVEDIKGDKFFKSRPIMSCQYIKDECNYFGAIAEIIKAIDERIIRDKVTKLEPNFLITKNSVSRTQIHPEYISLDASDKPRFQHVLCQHRNH